MIKFYVTYVSPHTHTRTVKQKSIRNIKIHKWALEQTLGGLEREQRYSTISSISFQSFFTFQTERKGKSLSRVWLFVTPWTVICEILQTRILEWVTIMFCCLQCTSLANVCCINTEMFLCCCKYCYFYFKFPLFIAKMQLISIWKCNFIFVY